MSSSDRDFFLPFFLSLSHPEPTPDSTTDPPRHGSDNDDDDEEPGVKFIVLDHLNIYFYSSPFWDLRLDVRGFEKKMVNDPLIRILLGTW